MVFSKKEKIVIAIIVAIIVLIFFVFILNGKTVPVAQTPKADHIAFDIKYWFFKQGYTSPVFTMKNPDNVVWENCEMTINKRYSSKIERFEIMASDSDILTIPVTNFTKKDGTAYDYVADPVKSACISCIRPSYDIYCGNFGPAPD